MHFRIIPPLAALLAGSFSHGALAQGGVHMPDEVSMTLPAPDLSIVVTGAPQQRSTLPVSVARIRVSDLDRLQNPVVADALATLAGVNVSRNGPVGGFTAVRIRGADAAQTLVVIDGIRVSDPTSPGGGFDFGSLLAGGIARIDVLRGSNSVVWGSDAMGGVVWIETGGPSRLTAEVGSLDTARIDGQYSLTAGPLNFFAAGGYYRTDGFSAARVGSEADGFRQYRGQARVALNLAANLEASANYIHADSRLDLDGFAPPAYGFGDTAEYQTAEENYASAQLAHQLGRFRHRLSFAIADINRDTFNPDAGTQPSFTARGRTEQLGWQGQWGEAGDTARIVVGAERLWSRSRTGDPYSVDQGSSATTGLYATASLRPARAMQVGVGARYDHHRHFGGDSSLSANALVDLTSALSLRGGYAEGYKAPTLFQLSPTASGFGNPALQPEQSRAYDIGLVYRRSEREVDGPPTGLRIEASLYRRDSRNLIDFVSCTGPAAPPICGSGMRPFGTYANVDRARAQGAELELTLWPAAGWQLAGSYSYTSTRDHSPGAATMGNRLARRPLHSATLALDYSGARFGIGGEIRIAGDQFDDAANLTRLDGYALANLRAHVDLTHRIELFGRLDNLFASEAQQVAGYGSPGRTVSLGIRAGI